jgi:endonuclease-3
MPPMRWTQRAIRKLVERLEAEYGRDDVREHLDPLGELISCILSQNTTDATSFPTYFALRKKYKSWDAIARLPENTLAAEIRAAGLANQKAKAILAALAAVRARFGRYTLEPLRQMSQEDAREWLESLPGVGPKTAAIVLCFGLGFPAIPVDTHVFRVSWRLGLIEKKVGPARAHRVLEAIVPQDLAYRFHVALIKHGRRTCTARKPKCVACVVRDRCRWYHEEGQQ